MINVSHGNALGILYRARPCRAAREHAPLVHIESAALAGVSAHEIEITVAVDIAEGNTSGVLQRARPCRAAREHAPLVHIESAALAGVSAHEIEITVAVDIAERHALRIVIGAGPRWNIRIILAPVQKNPWAAVACADEIEIAVAVDISHSDAANIPRYAEPCGHRGENEPSVVDEALFIPVPRSA